MRIGYVSGYEVRIPVTEGVPVALLLRIWKELAEPNEDDSLDSGCENNRGLWLRDILSTNGFPKSPGISKMMHPIKRSTTLQMSS